MNPVAIVKKHPVVAGVSALAVVAAIFIVARSNASASSGDGQVPLMVGQVGAVSSQGANDAIVAGVELEKLRTSAALTRESLAAETTIKTQEFSLQATLANLAALTATKKIEADERMGLATIEANRTISTLQINRDYDKYALASANELAASKYASDKALLAAQAAAAGAVSVAQLQKQQAALDAKNAITLANLKIKSDANADKNALALQKQKDAAALAAQKQQQQAMLDLAKIQKPTSGVWQFLFGG